MALIFDEQFETDPGYDETWTGGETEDTGCSLDPDQATSVAGSPPAWDSLCLYADVDGSQGDHAYVAGDLVDLSDEADTWLKIEFVCLANGLDTAGNIGRLLVVKDSAALLAYRVLLANDGGTFKIGLATKLNGVDVTTYYSDAISVNRIYRVEVKWETTKDLFEWRVNGVQQDAAALTGNHALGIDSITSLGLIAVSAGKDLTVAIDNVQIDDAGWVIAHSLIIGGNTYIARP